MSTPYEHRVIFRWSHNTSINLFQGEKFEGEDAKKCIGERMRHFLQDSSRDVQEPYFTVSEFIDWIFSTENQVFDASQVRKHSIKAGSHIPQILNKNVVF